eukprot:gb/GECG01009440.1/.p1 GENE.gb/GECG01009440.1/~~gb/GECG01009440.1/.p1  ORF type:complete len:881 (+),score=68.78 gb/GECG01009440.1/:1-2643(+)
MTNFILERYSCDALFASSCRSILHRTNAIRPCGSSLLTLSFSKILICFWIVSCAVGDTAIDLKQSIQAGNESCIHYHSEHNTFKQTCDIDWVKQGYTHNTFISLDANETFDGNSHVMFLEGISNFHGLFTTKSELVKSFGVAPLIRNVHTQGGHTAWGAGFILHSHQQFFVVDYCSSTGEIGKSGGGIAGYKVGYAGKITNCYTSGGIRVAFSGGIIGQRAGNRGRFLNISNCYSTGTIAAKQAGGIAGRLAGAVRGSVYIEGCYSKGKIAGKGSGGIGGGGTGYYGAYMYISECYSSGNISGHRAGGIVGERSAMRGGKVLISNSYTSGDALQDTKETGGICGARVGYHTGTVLISNVYLLGNASLTGGLYYGNHRPPARRLEVKRSVYKNDGVNSSKDCSGIFQEEGNSASYSDIRGKLYCYNSTECWSESVWLLRESNSFPELQALRACVEYYSGKRLYRQVRDIEWKEWRKEVGEYINLQNNVDFDGENHLIDLTGLRNFDGLFRIDDSVPNFEEAPLIKNVKTVLGRTSEEGGFIIQAEQRFFCVKNCSSSGEIGTSGGGIIGARSGRDGAISVSDSHATGKIQGSWSGGISGAGTARSGGSAYFTSTYSTALVEGRGSGGILGAEAGISLDSNTSSEVHVRSSFTFGNICGSMSGGILGKRAAANYGRVTVEECFTIGDVEASYSGGITGSETASTHGALTIVNSYSTGEISVDAVHSGGLCGSDTSKRAGTVYIENVYMLSHLKNSCMIGSISGGHPAGGGRSAILIKYSVYDGTGQNCFLEKEDYPAVESRGNSGDLTDISGALYHYNGVRRWSHFVWFIPRRPQAYPELRHNPQSTARAPTAPCSRPEIPAAHPKRAVILQRGNASPRLDP